MTLSSNQVEVAQAVLDVLDNNATDLGLLSTWYGPERIIPKFPSATVENGPESRSLVEGSTHLWRIDFLIYINLIYGEVQSGEVNQLAAEELAQAVKEVLHQYKTLGGLVIFGYVTQIEPVVLRASAFLRSMRLTWTAQSREIF